MQEQAAAVSTDGKDILHVIKLFNVPIIEQLRLEEALLRADDRNWCVVNAGSPPAIVMGISGKFNELVNQEKLASSPVPVIRRFSGGGTVFIDQNTHFISLICNTASVPISPFPEHIMRWTENIYSPLFPASLFRLQENDYVLGHQKCGGNAQSICKNRWLHHSSFLWDYADANMDYLLHPPKAPNYRAQRPHSEFLCRLSHYWPHAESFPDAVIHQLGAFFTIQEVPLHEIAKILDRPHRKATTFVLS